MSNGNGSIFEQIFAQGTMAAQRIPAELGLWLRVFAMHGIPRIALRLAVEDPCEQMGCQTRHAAGIRCESCRRSVCLGHALLAADGRGLCFGCAQFAAQPAPSAQADDVAVVAAFAVVGLAPTSSKEQVHKRVRTLLGQLHPDKNPGKGAAAAASEFKRVQDAHAVIRAARGWND